MPTERGEFETQDLGKAILSASFINWSGKIRFAKTELAKSPELLYEAASYASAFLDPSINGLCILATSGIPFGAVLSQMLGLPSYLYRRHGWRVTIGLQERISRILPKIPPGATLALVDSHSRSGATAATCYEQLMNTVSNVTVTDLVTLVGLDHLISRRIDTSLVPERSVASIKKYEEFVARLFGCDIERLYEQHLRMDSEVWHIRTGPTKIGQKRRVRGRLRNIITTDIEEPVPKVLNAELAQKLRNYPALGTDSGIWTLFEMPQMLRYIGRNVMLSLDWAKYDVLVGVCAIGSALAWALAYHAGFTGPVLSCYESPRIIPPPGDSLVDKTVLLVQGRALTGQDTEEALGRVEKAGGYCEEVLVLWWAPEMHNKKRCAPLYRLWRNGTQFIVLGGRNVP